MEKKQLYGGDAKAQLIAARDDRLYTFLLQDDTYRGVILNGVRLVNEMRANHGLGILETLILGQAYMATLLLAANLKDGARLRLQIECDGPVKRLITEADSFGEVRGYLAQVPIPIDKPLESFDTAPFFGKGTLSVTRYLPDAKTPFTGQVALRHGNLAMDLAEYYLQSEQTTSTFNLSVSFDKDGEVDGAGALMVQAMPGAEHKHDVVMATVVENLPSIGQSFAKGITPKDFVADQFQIFSPRFLEDRRVEFFCRCTRDRMTRLLQILPAAEREDILANGPFPIEIYCHFCGTQYSFDKPELENLFGALDTDEAERKDEV